MSFRALRLPSRAATARLAMASPRVSRSLNKSSATAGRRSRAADRARARADADTRRSGASVEACMLARLFERTAHIEVHGLLRLEHGFQQAALGLVLDVPN